MNHIDYDGPGELYISDISDARTTDKSNLDRVITVCQESIEDNVSDEMQYTHYCMADGPHNAYGGDASYEMFERAASELYRALANGERVLIHCHMGQSRSVSVAVAAIGRLTEQQRHEAFDTVRRYRIQAHPDNHLMEHAGQYINEHSDVEFRFGQS